MGSKLWCAKLYDIRRPLNELAITLYPERFGSLGVFGTDQAAPDDFLGNSRDERRKFAWPNELNAAVRFEFDAQLLRRC